jgi:hypothetical protein
MVHITELSTSNQALFIEYTQYEVRKLPMLLLLYHLAY